jgi:hypothetical protein
MLVQAFIAEAAVERFNAGILIRFSWLDEPELDAVPRRSRGWAMFRASNSLPIMRPKALCSPEPMVLLYLNYFQGCALAKNTFQYVACRQRAVIHSSRAISAQRDLPLC